MVIHSQNHLMMKKGSVLDLLAVRGVQEDVLFLKPGPREGRKYGAVVKIEPVGFSLMAEEEQEAVLEGYRTFLQHMAVAESLSIHVRVLPYDIHSYLAKLRETRNLMDEAAQRMSHDHEQFVLGLASEHSVLQREFYVRIVTIPETKRKRTEAEQFEFAKDALYQRCLDILDDASRCGLGGHRLDDFELIRYYQSCVHTHYAQKYPLEEMNTVGLDRPLRAISTSEIRAIMEDEETTLQEEVEAAPTTTQETPAPLEKRRRPTLKRRRKKEKQKKTDRHATPFSTLVELLEPALVSQQEHFIKIHKQETEYFRARCVIGYPAFVASGWLDRLIQINEPYVDIVLYIETLDPKRFSDSLTRKLTGFRATQAIEARAGRTENPYIEAAREEVEELRDRIVRQEEKVHSVSLYVGARATSIPELRQRDEKIISLLRGLDVESVECSLEHLQAWQTMLPDARDVLKRRKVLDTSSLVTTFPFGSTSLSTEPGILTGVTPDGSMVIVDPFSPTLENANEVKFAKSGSGKSFDEKIRISRFLQMGVHCVVVDPENEFERLREAYNGTSVSLSAGRLALNPFYVAPTDIPDRDILEEKISSLLTLFDLLLADRSSDRATGVLSQKEKSILEITIRHAYYEMGITSRTITHDREPPKMTDLYKHLKQGIAGTDGAELADRLNRFINAFPRETDRNLLDSPLVIFSMRDLPDDLRPVALFLISEYVWTQVRREPHPRPRLLSIDEAWTLLQFDAGGRALAALARRARKYNLGVRITTQLVNDFLSSESGQAILANANKLVLKTDAANIDAVTTALKLTEGERRYLLGARKGEGLYFLGQAQGQTHVPIQIVASQAEYDMANTNAQELRQQEMMAAAKYTIGNKLRAVKPSLVPFDSIGRATQ
jgi:hypothetical protein